MHLAINEGDRDKSQIIVSKLTAIADLIEKTRK